MDGHDDRVSITYAIVGPTKKQMLETKFMGQVRQ